MPPKWLHAQHHQSSALTHKQQSSRGGKRIILSRFFLMSFITIAPLLSCSEHCHGGDADGRDFADNGLWVPEGREESFPEVKQGRWVVKLKNLCCHIGFRVQMRKAIQRVLQFRWFWQTDNTGVIRLVLSVSWAICGGDFVGVFLVYEWCDAFPGHPKYWFLTSKIWWPNYYRVDYSRPVSPRCVSARTHVCIISGNFSWIMFWLFFHLTI